MSKQVALERELSQLKTINGAIGNLISTIQSTNKDISEVNDSVIHTNALMFKWTQILSQTSYTREIINNPNWNGDDMDLEAKYEQEQDLEVELAKIEKENEDLTRKLEDEPIKRRKY